MIDRRGMLAAAGGALATAGLAARPRLPREVLAFYYGWYGLPDRSGEWLHWQGPGGRAAPRQSPTVNMPAGGPYDSHDPALVAAHADLARQAGITAFVASWWGRGSFADRSFALLLDAMHARGLKTTIYLERQQTGPAGAVADLRYLIDTYGDHPGLLRVGGRPVLFLYLQALRDLPAAGWRRAARAAAGAGPEPLLIGDASPREAADFGAWAPHLDGIHVYTMAPYVKGMAAPAIRAWAAETYPRWKAAIGDRIWCATVMPGFDDTLVPGRAAPRPTVARNDGGTFAALWDAAIAARADWVIVSTFNEWHEGSEIEPSAQQGARYIAMNRLYADRFR